MLMFKASLLVFVEGELGMWLWCSFSSRVCAPDSTCVQTGMVWWEKLDLRQSWDQHLTAGWGVLFTALFRKPVFFFWWLKVFRNPSRSWYLQNSSQCKVHLILGWYFWGLSAYFLVVFPLQFRCLGAASTQRCVWASGWGGAMQS